MLCKISLGKTQTTAGEIRMWIQNAPIKVIDYASSAEIDRNKEIEKEAVKERKKGT